ITVSAGTEPTCQIINGTTTTTYATTATNNTGFNWSLSNALAGTIDPATGIMAWANGFSGTVDIRVTANGCNGPSAQVIRTVNITPTVGAPTAITIFAGTEPTCQLTSGTTITIYSTTATNSTGLNWSLSNGLAGTINPSSGVMIWTSGFAGSVDIQVAASGCNGPSPQTIRTVNITPTVGTPAAITVFAGAEPSCQLTSGTTTTTYATTSTNSTGFNWSLSNPLAGVIDPVTGVMTWANGFSGTVNIQVTANGCNGPSAQVVRTVNITPTVGTPTAITVSAGTEPACQLTNNTTTTTYGTTATNNTGFNWSISNAFAGTINPTSGVMTWVNGFSGSVNIQVTANGCNGPSAQTIRPVTVNPIPAANAGTNTAICSGNSAQIGAVPVVGNTYSWSSVPSGFTSTVSNPSVNPLVTTIYTLTETVTATGCNNSNSVTVTVNPTPVADFSANNLKPPLNTTVTFSDLSTGGATGWSWSFAPATVTFVGGTTATSQNPQVQFTAGGLYNVTLISSIGSCPNTMTKTGYIRAGTAGIWTGLTSVDWSIPSNWQNYLTPGSGDNIVIPPGVPNWPTVTGNLTQGGSLSLTATTCNLTITGNLTLQSGSSVSNLGTILIQGNLINQNAAASTLGTGTVTFNGTGLQTISGLNIFGKMTVNNPAGVSLSNDQQINGVLTLTSGLITLGANSLTMGTTATIAGVPSASSMVVPTSTGQLRKMFSSVGSFTFPVGDVNITAKYTPVSMTFTSGTFAAGAYAGVNLMGAKYPTDTNTIAYVKRFWNLVQSGITTFNCNAVFNYLTGDVVGSEFQIYAVRISPTPAVTYNQANSSLHQLTAGGLTSFGTFTGTIVYTPLTLKVYLQGLYAGAGIMNNANNFDGVNILPKWGPAIADHITVEIHDALNYTIIKKVISDVPLNINGTATINIPSLQNGNYYITVKHRNSIETACAAPQAFAGAALSYNFSDAASKAFGGNMKAMGGGVFAIYAGDVTDFMNPYPGTPVQDGIVDIMDLYYIYSSYVAGDLGYFPSDLNGDGLVDVLDLYLDYDNYLLGVYAMLP
ncbi:MAG: hypothetical protein WCI71_02325, partial [Bacteroidota bacterium]